MAGSSLRLALEGEEPERMTPAREKSPNVSTEGLTPEGCCLLESPFQTPIPAPSGYSRSQRLSRSDTS